MAHQIKPRRPFLPDLLRRPHQGVALEDGTPSAARKGSTWYLYIPSSGTHDFTGGEADPETGLTPDGDYAGYSTLERSSSGIRAVIAAPASQQKAYLYVPIGDIHYAGWPAHSILARIDVTTLGGASGANISFYLGENPRGGAACRERTAVALQYDGANRVIFSAYRRKGTLSVGGSAAVAGWNTDAWIRLQRGITEIQASHQEAGTTTVVETTPQTADMPCEVDANYMPELAIQLNCPAGASLDLTIKELYVSGVPIL